MLGLEPAGDRSLLDALMRFWIKYTGKRQAVRRLPTLQVGHQSPGRPDTRAALSQGYGTFFIQDVLYVPTTT